MSSPCTLTETVEPARKVHGRLRLPGDKSISHRYALLAALADGASRVSPFAPGADCAATLACLRGLGVTVERLEETTVQIIGRGPRGLSGDLPRVGQGPSRHGQARRSPGEGRRPARLVEQAPRPAAT